MNPAEVQGKGVVPAGKHTKSYGKSPYLVEKLNINGQFQ
jgi:hypothetical protein